MHVLRVFVFVSYVLILFMVTSGPRAAIGPQTEANEREFAAGLLEAGKAIVLQLVRSGIWKAN